MSLRKKSRILLPESCVLIGIVDPSGVLEENEIFVQVRKDNFKSTSRKSSNMIESELLTQIEGVQRTIDGDVLVTRSPCTHPGDIRRLKAVNKPELAHLFNVVIFSSKGDRPACNMMSGGDLDGDVYFVTWDPELLPHIPLCNI